MVRRLGRNLAGQSKKFWIFLSLAIFSFVLLASCNNTCVSFTSNPPTGTINVTVTNPAPTYPFVKGHGMVRVVARAVSPCNSETLSCPAPHVIITVRCVAIHASPVADDASPDWQELLPQLSRHPLQIDLSSGSGSSNALQPLAETATIPADTYRQVRVRLVESQPEAWWCSSGLHTVLAQIAEPRLQELMCGNLPDV